MLKLRPVWVLIAILSVSSLSYGQGDAEQPYRFEFSVEKMEDSVAYLGYHFGLKKYLLDTAAVENNGKVVFEGKRDLKTGIYFLYSPTYYLEFVIDGEYEFSITTDKDKSYKNMVVKGSSANEQYRDFQLIMMDHQLAVKALSESLDSTSTAADTTLARESIALLNNKNAANRDSLLIAYQDTYMGVILTMMNGSPELVIEGDSLTLDQKKEQYAFYKEHFFDGLDFDSEGLLRAPNFHNKVKEYIDRVTFQIPDSIIASVDYVLKKSENNPEMYRYWVVNFFQDYQNPKLMGMDKVFVHVADNYYLNGKADWADSAFIASLKKEMVFQRENQIGLKAPQINLIDTLENRTTLYDIKADYLVLFFYDPDCGHCKKKTPVLRDAYHEADGNFEVAAICVGTDMDKWKGFIKKFELDWIDLADIAYQSNFRVQYNVRSTPQIYILNKDKEIIGKRLDVEQIADFIKDQKRIDALK